MQLKVTDLLLAKKKQEDIAEVLGISQSAVSKRRAGQKAKVAIARKLLTAIFNILSKNEPYNPTLYHKDDNPPVARVISQEQAISILANMGYVLDPLVLSVP